MSVECESNLFSRVMVTDRIGRQNEVQLQFIIKITISENERKIKSRCILQQRKSLMVTIAV